VEPSPSIFKAYDVRGIVGDTLTEPVVRAIGQALGLLISRASIGSCVIGRDGRLSGPSLSAALAQGLNEAGVDAIDIGQVPTPVVYYATVATGCGSGVALTGSHNPPEYNGLKMMVAGATLWGDGIAEIRRLIVSGQAAAHVRSIPAERRGRRISAPEHVQTYLQAIVDDIHLARPMRVAIDAGNGVAGGIAPELLGRIGCHVQALYCEVDGNFPNHHPDPAHVENLRDLIECVRSGDAELGLAFDGDGDRLGVVTRSGAIIWPDRQMMLYAADVLKTRPGAEIIFDVKCTRHLAAWIRQHGGVPTMWKTGHSLIKAKLRETAAPLAGEMSGHIFFNDRWHGFDDALYTACRLLEIVSRSADPGLLLEALPDSASTPEIHLPTAEGENVEIVEALAREGSFPGAVDRILIDGIRVEYPDGFGLARPSNTTPVIVLRFEADDQQALARIQSGFRDSLLRIRPGMRIPF
jgi:phosphomannomutase/phosphoglucomutase